ncbi:Aste57867_17653 [Aphanomyces stellatus]|uniref:PRA1 family protein n=1 Tax=Aphanomyces stellatus TaxID=120398 RepID=A0A485L9H0_9STRA|nr:hypothetical protein As57867_017592 [Aphanomyces stellatus]VFT94404.1 Aste57867_17653 [Aphanomyces stellatus]
MGDKLADAGAIPSPKLPAGQLDVVKAKLKDIMSLKNLRGVVLFFGLGEPKPFQVPAKEVAMNRTRKNLLYFATNYAVVAILVGFISILMNPFFLFVLMCIGALWYQNAQISAQETEDKKFQIAGRNIDPSQRNVILLIFTAVLVIYFGGSVLFSIASMSALLSASHAFLRNSTIPDEDDLGFTEEIALPEP